MAKIRIPIPRGMPELDVAPLLFISHVYADENPLGFAFHSIALWNWLWYNPGGVLILCNWDPDDQPPIGETQPVQLLMAHELLADPALVNDMCPYCNGRWGTPKHVRWNIHRGGTYPYGTAICPYDGSWPIIWSPDQWPPAWWW